MLVPGQNVSRQVATLVVLAVTWVSAGPPQVFASSSEREAHGSRCGEIELPGERIEGNTQVAIRAFKGAIKAVNRPEDQRLRGIAMTGLGESYLGMGGPNRVAAIQAAIVCADAAIELLSPVADRLHWVRAMLLRGTAYLNLPGPGRAAYRQQSVTTCRLALDVLTKNEDPSLWAQLWFIRGAAHREMTPGPDWRSNLEESIRAYNLAMEVFTPEEHPWRNATILYSLGVVYYLLRREDGNFAEANRYFHAALCVLTRNEFPQNYAEVMVNLGYIDIAASGPQVEQHLKRAVSRFEKALAVLTPESDPIQWARARGALGIAMVRLGGSDQQFPWTREGIKAMNESLSVFEKEGFVEEGSVIREHMEGAEGSQP